MTHKTWNGSGVWNYEHKKYLNQLHEAKLNNKKINAYIITKISKQTRQRRHSETNKQHINKKKRTNTQNKIITLNKIAC